jgi:hypothetical protein
MRVTIKRLVLVGTISLIGCGVASSAPISPFGLKKAAVGASAVQPAQYYEHHTRHRVIKCYRELVVGRYVCHSFYRWWW